MKLNTFGNATCLILFLSNTTVHAQNVNIDGLKNILKAKPVVISGGASANNIFNSAAADRPESLTYYFQGSMNANLFGQINLPFSYSFTNVGTSYTQPVPPNRLDLHPTYKWISAHIGQIAMTFSPYTLNGHQFAGAGVDLTPPGRWKMSAMAGRLLKAVAYDPNSPKTLPSYERMGYGSKIAYEKDGFRLGISAFYGKDNPTTLAYKPDTLLLFPQQNLAIGYTAQFKPMPGLDVNIAYATSALTLNDNDKNTIHQRNYLQTLMGTSKSTAFYNALKGGINYTFNKVILGVGYEHIDPGYRTLGAYFFSNDFENITVNVAHSFLKGKVSMSGNVGLQYDNLDGKKSRTTKRTVGSISMNCTPIEKLQLNTSYSNFGTYMNVQSQFQKINQPTTFDNPESPNDFVQISQNANLNAILTTRKNDVQNQQLNVTLGFQDASDEKGGVVSKGNGSQFYNLSTGYNLIYLKKALSVIGVYNLSYNTIGRKEILTHGPTLSVSSKLLEKKMTAGVSFSYNTSAQEGIAQNDTFNIRLNAAYAVLKSHNLNISLVNQYRSSLGKALTSNFTGTLGYSYSF